ncbi:uncharacterized protein LOC143376575 [Andrena cerasifolii]|uniref:uncharacterized protein LOC143376575 n=1 Tax=Andrena cerasifolii TaxID=2819439 RepID=UPI004037B8C0
MTARNLVSKTLRTCAVQVREVSTDLDQDLRLAIGWNRLNLKLIGIWPEPTATGRASLSYLSLIIILWMIAFIILPQTTNLFMLNGDLDLITNNLCVANIPTTNAIVKILIISYYREGLKPIVKCFYDDWRSAKTEEERTAMLTAAKVWRFISTSCTVLTHMLVTAFVSVRAFTIYTCDRDQEAQDHLLLYHGYFPFNIRPTSILLLANMGQAVAAYCATIPYTGVDAFISMLVLHTCSQFENLRMRLEGLMDQENGTRNVDQVQKELVWIVRRHEHLNWVASRIEKYFNILMLIQVLLSTIEICFQGFLFFNVILQNEDGIWNFQLVFFVLFVTFVVVHIYLYCYVGEMLLVQSNGMANSAYNSTWFNVSSQDAKCLLFIMNRSIRPLRLTAGKFGTFSIEMFSAIIRTAMGYLSVLLTVSAGSDLQLYTALIIIVWVTIFIILPQTTNLFMLNGDLDQITNNLSLANIPTINAVVKILVTWYYREGLRVLVKSFYDDWRGPKTEEERTTMLNRAKVSRFISTWCTVLTQTMVTAYLSLRALTIYTCDQDEETQDNLVLYPGYFPYNVRPTTILVLTNVGQVVAAYTATIPYTSVDAFIAMLVLHTCSQFENLRMRLEGLMDDKNGTRSVHNVRTELVSIVKRHEHLNWVASRIEEYFNILLLIQMLLCTVEICFQGFLFFNVILHNEDGIWNFQLAFFVLFVNFIVVHMYIYCYVGEMLLVQSNGMGISAYNSSWFNVSAQEAKYLLIIMNRSIVPLRLTAGNFGTFSMEMFSTVSAC